MANLASILFLTTTLCACSSDGSGGGDPTPDAAPSSDGAPASDAPAGTAASVVPCAGATIAGDIWYYDGVGYIGSALNTDLPVGSIVEFHDMSSHTADHVQGVFSASGDASQCVKFTGLGSYEFRCYFHGNEVGAIKIVDTVGP